MFVTQGIVLFLLLFFTASHPSHKRETSPVSTSKSSQDVINDGKPVNSEPVSTSPDTATLSCHHLKEANENSVNFHNRWSVSSMIVGSSSAFLGHEKISLAEASSDTTNLEAPTILVDGSRNCKVDSHVTSNTNSIKSSIETVPTISKRNDKKYFKFPKWNLNSLRNWRGLMGTTRRIGGVKQGIQRPQSMPNFQSAQGIQPGQVSQNRMPSNAAKTNNENKASSKLMGGIKSSWQKLTGLRAGKKNIASVAKSNSPTASSVMDSDKLTVPNVPVKVASEMKNSRHSSSDYEDSQTEGYESNSYGRNMNKFDNSQGLSDFPASQYYSSSDDGEYQSPSSLSNRRIAKSTNGRPKRESKPSSTDPNPPETNSVNSEIKTSPAGNEILNSEDTRFKNVQFMDQKSEFFQREMDTSGYDDEPMNGHRYSRRPPADYDMRDYQMGESGGDYRGRNTGSRIAHAIENILPIAATVGNIVTGKGNMGHGAGGYGGGYGGDYDSMEAMGGYGASGYRSSGYGSSGYGSSGYGSSGYGAGGMGGYGAGGSMGGYGAGGYGADDYGAHGHRGGGGFGANELGGGNIGVDPMDAHDLLGETRSKALEKSASKKTGKTKKNKNEPKVDTEKNHEEDEKDTHNKSSDHSSKKLKINDNNKNETISIDNDETGNKVSSQDSATTLNNPTE